MQEINRCCEHHKGAGAIMGNPNDIEIWKSIEGYEGLYEVSNFGRIKSLPKYNRKQEKILHPTLNKKRGRLSVMLCKNAHSRKRFAVHKLVALAFVENPNPSCYFEVNHKDENPLNNVATNLEWCDRWYNMHFNNLKDRISRPQRKKSSELMIMATK